QGDGRGRREGIGMEEEERIAARVLRARIHQRGTSRAAGPEDTSSAGGNAGRTVTIAGGGHDHLCFPDSCNIREAVERTAERGRVVPARHDDGDGRSHALMIGAESPRGALPRADRVRWNGHPSPSPSSPAAPWGGMMP